MNGIYAESNLTDVNSTTIRGTKYIVCSFFDGEEAFANRIESLICESFQSSSVQQITNESLSD